MVAQHDYTLFKKGTVLQRLVIMAGILCLLLILFAPYVEQSREQARRSHSMHNLKQIGIALLNYHDQHQLFPPGAIKTTDGTPYHGWQTQILPFIDQSDYYGQGIKPKDIYNKIDFNKTWNDPVNQVFFQQKISQYLNPTIQETTSSDGYALSHYVGNELLLKENKGVRIREITDGTSNTIMAMEIGEVFKPWGDPASMTKPAYIIGPGRRSSFPDGNHVLFSDGKVSFVSKDIDPAIMKALSTPSGSETTCEF